MGVTRFVLSKIIKQSNIVSRSATCPSVWAAKGYKLLIAYAHECLKKDPKQRSFTIYASDISRFLGDADPHEFEKYLSSLVHTVVKWDLFPQAKSEGIIGGEFAMLSGWEKVKDADGKDESPIRYTYSFHSKVQEEILFPRCFRYFGLTTIQKFNSRYALKLYDFCYSALNDKNSQVYTQWVNEDTLKELLGCKGKYKKQGKLKERVLNPAIQEVNTVSEITIKLRQEGRGEGNRSYQFVVNRKASAFPTLVAKFPQVLPDEYFVHPKEGAFFEALKIIRELHKWIPLMRLTRSGKRNYLLFSTTWNMNHIQQHFTTSIRLIAKEIRIRQLDFQAVNFD